MHVYMSYSVYIPAVGFNLSVLYMHVYMIYSVFLPVAGLCPYMVAELRRGT